MIALHHNQCGDNNPEGNYRTIKRIMCITLQNLYLNKQSDTQAVSINLSLFGK
jgi:hypothetical protein